MTESIQVNHTFTPDFKQRFTLSHAQIYVSPLAPRPSSISLSFTKIPAHLKVTFLLIQGADNFQYFLISGFVSKNATIYNRVLGVEFPTMPITESDDYYVVLRSKTYSNDVVRFTRIVQTASYGLDRNLIESCKLDCEIDIPGILKNPFVIFSNNGAQSTVFEMTQKLRRNIWTRYLLLWFLIGVTLFSTLLVALISLLYILLGILVGDVDEEPRNEREEEREYSGWGVYRHEALPVYVGRREGGDGIPEYGEDDERGPLVGPPSYKSNASLSVDSLRDASDDREPESSV
jgi:hypothetical protein